MRRNERGSTWDGLWSARGMTVVELLVVLALIGVLVTLSAAAFRRYWLVRSLHGSQEHVVAEMRRAQQKSLAESYPNVYGLRFTTNTSTWALVKGKADTSTCSVVTTYTFDGNVVTQTPPTGYAFEPVSGLTSACQGASPAAPGSQVVFFYPAGSTNAAPGTGSKIVIHSPLLARTRTVTVSPLTGKVVAS